MDGDYLDLLELQLRLRTGIADLFPERVWVCAEVASVQRKAGGHCYLELCQNEDGQTVAKVRAVIWRSRYALVGAAYEDACGAPLKIGDRILALVEVNYSELYGMTLVIDDIDPQHTLGEAELARQRTIAYLKEKGLMERQQELSLPGLPRRLAVISARDAAGYGDFCRHLESNEYGFSFTVDLFEATMQGESAPRSIVEALKDIEAVVDGYDAVLLMRGGGSNLDLACFDDCDLCSAIALCPLPVFTAIGHDRDFHIADMVSFRFVKTPTALADEFIEALAAEDELISSFGTRLKLAFSSKIALRLQKLEHYKERIASADPRNILSRGYSLLTDSHGVVLKSASGLSSGDEVRILLKDGRINAVVKNIEK